MYGTFGRFDFAVMVEAETPEEMGNLITDCIRGIKGVLNTETRRCVMHSENTSQSFGERKKWRFGMTYLTLSGRKKGFNASGIELQLLSTEK